MDGKIGDRDFTGAGAEHRGELLVERICRLGARGCTTGLCAEIEGKYSGRLIVCGEQDSVGPEGQWPDRRERWGQPCRCRLAGGRGRPGGEDDNRNENPEL